MDSIFKCQLTFLLDAATSALARDQAVVPGVSFAPLIGGGPTGMILLALFLCAGTARCGETPAAVVFTVQQDHLDMMRQLGISKLRPGRSGDANSPNAANYDEAKANPYPNLPEVLAIGGGERVTSPEQWWKVRRPEIVEAFEREIVGRVPEKVPEVRWEVRESRDITAGGKPAVEKHIVGVVDNSACPEIEVNISMSLTLPRDAPRPVPVLMSFGWTPFDASPFGRRGVGLRGRAGPTKKDMLIAAGWGCATLNPSSVQDDAGGALPSRVRQNADAEAAPTGAGLTRGVIGLTNRGQPRKPDDWGALRAWAWGASRGLDYLESVSDVDPDRVGIAGVSRYGKAALVAMAFDQRFAMGLIASSGEGGTSLYRRNFGEAPENLAGPGGYHWMAGNFLKYSAEESSFGRLDAGDMPVDSHQLIAMCAPRLTFISHGVPERGDALWLDHQGSFMAAVAAQPVFRLLGASGLRRSDDYRLEKMPRVNVGLLEGHLAWRQHDGGHTDEPNIERFIRWADKMLNSSDVQKDGRRGATAVPRSTVRERISINRGWRFMKYKSATEADSLVYDVRPEVRDFRDDLPADAMPTRAQEVEAIHDVLKPWVLPSGNNFLRNPADRHTRPPGDPGSDFPFVQTDFDDSVWELVNLPHDWAIAGPFMTGWQAPVGGGMGRLPSPGVGWYRKKLDIPASDTARSVFLDVDGAMSYAVVWCNGHLAGGWPYGYASWRVDLTPYLNPGGTNQLAIRLDNPPDSSRWYPGGGIYRNVWLTKTSPLRVAHWGVCVTTPEVSEASATIDMQVEIVNDSNNDADVELIARVYELNDSLERTGDPVATFDPITSTVATRETGIVTRVVTLRSPRLWGPPPNQTPHLYVVETTLMCQGKAVDKVETRFGIRSVRFNPNAGVEVNGELIKIKGANLHHDLGALGAAFNTRAAERQLEVLREMGCNAIRTAHNPPAPEFLDLTDRMGFLVTDETFDVWERKKTPLDFHLIFPDWHEPDTRAMVRRDRNHPSVVLWSIGNEVGEQYTGEGGARIARKLHDIVKQEDPTRPTTTAMNFAKPSMPLPAVVDVIGLNYQGEGIRNAPAYKGLPGISTPPLFLDFHETLPNKVILSSENAAAVSSRGAYLFPVVDGASAPVKDGYGGDPHSQHVSAYELYTAPFGSSADKVFGSLDEHPYVAGGFVWSGWDYLGEPTPFYGARSSYFGAIDLAGFKKDRFYLYQSHWRPELPMAHILPHWNWPERKGEVTPVHVFTSGDEAELFLNGKSLGRKKKGKNEYRLRWDDVAYEPGELRVAAYKSGKAWSEDSVKTTGKPAQLIASVDREAIRSDGEDLAFVTVRVADGEGLTNPRAENLLRFTLEGAGEIVSTDNGDPTDMTPFPSHERNAFNGFCLVIVRGFPGRPGVIELKVESDFLKPTAIKVRSQGGL